MKIIETYIVNWTEKEMGQVYQSLCKIHLLEDRTYIREYETGKKTQLEVISKEQFIKQAENTLW